MTVIDKELRYMDDNNVSMIGADQKRKESLGYAKQYENQLSQIDLKLSHHKEFVVRFPECEKLIDGGLNPKMAVWIGSIADSVGPMPSKKYIDIYAAKVCFAVDTIAKILHGTITFENANDHDYEIPNHFKIADDILPSQVGFLSLYSIEKSHTVRHYSGDKHCESYEAAFDYVKEHVNGSRPRFLDAWTESGKDGFFVGLKIDNGKYVELRHFHDDKEIFNVGTLVNGILKTELTESVMHNLYAQKKAYNDACDEIQVLDALIANTSMVWVKTDQLHALM